MYLLLLLICSYFVRTFYLSYEYNESVVFLFFHLSPLEFLAFFYCFLGGWLYKKGLFIFEKQTFMLFILFSLSTLMLVLLKQYSFLILFSFSFMFALTNNKYLVFLFFVYINAALIILFQSSSYMFYFFTLIMSLLPAVYMFKSIAGSFFHLSGMVITVFYLLHYFFAELFYGIYIYFDIVDKELLHNNFIFTVLTLLHMLFLFTISRNRVVLNRIEKAWAIILLKKTSTLEG